MSENKKDNSDEDMEQTPDFSRIEESESRRASITDFEEFTKHQSFKDIGNVSFEEGIPCLDLWRIPHLRLLILSLDIGGNINYCQTHKKLIYNFCKTCEEGCCNEWYLLHKKHDIEPLELVTKAKLKEWGNIVEILEDEKRRLKEKLRVRKATRDKRRTQLLAFFDACFQELERIKTNYVIDLDNDDIMFEQEFENLQDRINSISSEIDRCVINRDISKILGYLTLKVAKFNFHYRFSRTRISPVRDLLPSQDVFRQYCQICADGDRRNRWIWNVRLSH